MHLRANPGPAACAWLLSALLCAPVGVRAQAVGNSPVVQAEAVVVSEAHPGMPQPGATQIELDPDAPVGSASWQEAASRAPNLGISQAGETSFGALYSLRGLSNTPYFSDPAVTLYLDDIPMGGGFTYPSGLFSFASASVFSGPQPTTFGRSADGGVIILSPRPPQAGGEVRAGMGGYGSRTGAIEAGSPGGSPAEVSVAGAFTHRDGYVDNTEIGRTVDSVDAMDGFARGRFHPTPATQVTVEILADRHRDGAAPLVPLDGPLYTVQRAREGTTDSSFFAAAIKASADTGAGPLTAVTSYTGWKLDPFDDWLVLPPPLLSHLTLKQERWNEEFRFSPFGFGVVTWNAGAWLSGASTSGDVERSIRGTFPIEATGFGYTRREAALFGDVVLEAPRRWRITLGGRAQRVAEDYHQAERVPTRGLAFRLGRTDDAFLPRLAATYEVAAGTTADASATLGTRPGGFAAYTDNPAFIPFAAEHVAAFEAGVRRSSADRNLDVSARVFDYEIRNYQIERSFSAKDYFVATAPRARSLGAELGAHWNPAPGWRMGLTAGVTDITLLEFRDPLSGRSLGGTRAPYAPSFTAALDAGFRSAKGWFASAAVVARGRTFYTESEDPAYSQGAYATLDGTVGFDSGRWRVAAYVENAADKGYYALIVPGVNSAAPGTPRTAGTELAIEF